MNFHRISCSILIVLASACDLGDKSIGNDTGADQGEAGDGDGDGDGNPGDGDGDGDGPCGAETVSIITDLDAELPAFGVTTNDYLAQAVGTFLGDFTWLPNDGPVTNEHGGTSSPLTVIVSYDGGEVRLTEVEFLGQSPGEIDVCGNELEIDVTLEFATEDGLFAETFEVPLRANSHGDGPQPTFHFPLDLDAFVGQLALDDFSYEDGEITELTLMGDFADGLVQGGFGMEVLTMDWVGFGSVGGFDAVREP